MTRIERGRPKDHAKLAMKGHIPTSPFHEFCFLFPPSFGGGGSRRALRSPLSPCFPQISSIDAGNIKYREKCKTRRINLRYYNASVDGSTRRICNRIGKARFWDLKALLSSTLYASIDTSRYSISGTLHLLSRFQKIQTLYRGISRFSSSCFPRCGNFCILTIGLPRGEV